MPDKTVAQKRKRGGAHPASAVCPICQTPYSTARGALECWLRHEPNLPLTLTLDKIGERLGVSKQRIHQVLVSLGDWRRYRRHLVRRGSKRQTR